MSDGVVADGPSVVIVAGPNGAGKSTAAPALLRGRLAVDHFVNADDVARGLSAYAPETMAVQAGRIVLARLKDLAAARADFAFETTLATRSFAPWLRSLVATGYEFRLVFLWLPSADMAVARVAGRVRQGGHHVPEDVVRRRYAAGMRNFRELYSPLAASWRVYDSSAVRLHHALIAEGSGRDVLSVGRPGPWRRFQAQEGG